MFTSMTSKPRYVYDGLIIFLLGIIALYCAWLYRNFAQDDAFITYRYARNIVNGYGFVYNLHEPVLGTTTPLYTLVLALVGKLSRPDMPLISHLISALSLWGSGVVLYFLGKNNQALSAAAISLIFISNPLLVSAIGMETFFFIFILLLALHSYVTGRFKLSGVLLGLLTLTRYEGILWGGLLGLHFLARRKQLPLWLGLTAALFTVWLIFAWGTFGVMIPQSAAAKLISPANYSFIMGALIWWGIYMLQAPWYALFLPLIGLGIYAAFQYNKRDKRGEPAYPLILAWTGIYFVVASLVAGSFPWYYGPLIPGLSILLVWGIECLVKLLNSLLRRFQASPRFFDRESLTVLFISLSFVALQLSSWGSSWVNYQGQIVDVRYVTYRQVAEWLNRHAAPDDSLATEEIGVLGYYADLKIIDLLGLVTPGLEPWLVRGRVETLNRVIALYSPTYILVKENESIQLLQTSPGYVVARQFGNYFLYRKK